MRDWRQAVNAERKRYMAAMQRARRKDPENLPAGGFVPRLSDAILQHDHFARDSGRRLFVFRDGAYRPNGEEHVKRRAKALLTHWGERDTWTARKVRDLIEFVTVDSPELWPTPPSDVINLRNGLLRLDLSGKGLHSLEEHSPAHLSPIQLPVSYDQLSMCPAWDRFVKATFPPDAVEASIAYQIAGLLMTPDMSSQVAILLLGDGGNGKTVYLTALEAFIGSENVTNKSLHYLESNRFATAALMSKLANICPDLPSSQLSETSLFKMITGGDRISAEYKNGALFEFRPFCKLVFSANQPPRSGDSTQGFYRRWITISFDRTFTGKDRIPHAELDAMLAAPSELSGVLNNALAELPRVLARGVTVTPSMQHAAQEFREATDPLGAWLDEHVIEHLEAFVVKEKLRRAYQKYAQHHGYTILTMNAFGRQIHRRYPKVTGGQRTVEGKSKTVYIGIDERLGSVAVGDGALNRVPYPP